MAQFPFAVFHCAALFEVLQRSTMSGMAMFMDGMRVNFLPPVVSRRGKGRERERLPFLHGIGLESILPVIKWTLSAAKSHIPIPHSHFANKGTYNHVPGQVCFSPELSPLGFHLQPGFSITFATV